MKRLFDSHYQDAVLRAAIKNITCVNGYHYEQLEDGLVITLIAGGEPYKSMFSNADLEQFSIESIGSIFDGMIEVISKHCKGTTYLEGVNHTVTLTYREWLKAYSKYVDCIGNGLDMRGFMQEMNHPKYSYWLGLVSKR